MKICLISEEYPLSYKFGGGIGSYMYILAHSLTKLGEKVIVITRSQDKERELDDENIHIYQVSPIKFPLPYFHTYLNIFGYSLAVYWKLKKILKEREISVVEAPDFGGEAFFFSHAKKRIPLIVRLHAPHFITEEAVKIRPNLSSLLVRWMERETIIHADEIISPTRYLAEVCQVRMKINRSITIIPNPIDVFQFAKVDYSSRLSQQIILSVTRFQDLKNVKILVEAIPLVSKNFPHIKVRIIGNDTLTGPGNTSYRQMVSKLAEELGVRDKIEFLDVIPKETLIKYYQQARLTVIPSLFENFPYCCLESMSCGCPVVASRVGGIPEIIEEGISGLMFQPDCKEELAQKILLLLTKPFMAERLGDAGALRVRQYYSQEIVIPKILDIYQRLWGRYKM